MKPLRERVKIENETNKNERKELKITSNLKIIL